ncbi:MAG: 2'-5' RNA ligase family protein [Rhodocyclaceae bacterium]|nr:MAG: 2'-5' RNA ligase family protein [Rhodocyclaceae bacterium]
MRDPAQQAWEAFLAGGRTQANEMRDFPEWHRGRERYTLWAIDLAPCTELQAPLGAARQALEGLLLPGYQRELHLTLHVCGFPAEGRVSEDDFDGDQFSAQVAALQAARLRPFNLTIGGLGSFATAPFLAVGDGDAMLPRLRAALAAAGEEWRDTPYVPHATVGIYNGSHPAAEVARRRETFPMPQAVSIPVRRIALMAYASRVIGGPLQTLCEFDLADNLLLPGASLPFVLNATP